MRAGGGDLDGWSPGLSHMCQPDGSAPSYVEIQRYQKVKNTPFDPARMEFDNRRMSKVFVAGGTLPGAHSRDRYRWQDRIGADRPHWLSGRSIRPTRTSRRTAGSSDHAPPHPDVIVCVLFEGGEHGRLAARLANPGHQGRMSTSQRRTPTQDGRPGTKKVEIGGLWTAPSDDSEDHLHVGRS